MFSSILINSLGYDISKGKGVTELNEDILSLLLQTESEYHAAMKNATKEAEDYADDSKEKQNAYIEGLKQEWDLFEKAENDKLAKMLADDEVRLEAKTAELKEQLRISQKKKADLISERLKEEVLSLYGHR